MAGVLIRLSVHVAATSHALSERNLASASASACVDRCDDLAQRASYEDARAQRQPLQRLQLGQESTHMVLAISKAAHRRARRHEPAPRRKPIFPGCSRESKSRSVRLQRPKGPGIKPCFEAKG